MRILSTRRCKRDFEGSETPACIVSPVVLTGGTKWFMAVFVASVWIWRVRKHDCVVKTADFRAKPTLRWVDAVAYERGKLAQHKMVLKKGARELWQLIISTPGIPYGGSISNASGGSARQWFSSTCGRCFICFVDANTTTRTDPISSEVKQC